MKNEDLTPNLRTPNLRSFVECVRTGAPIRSPASDTLHDVAAFEAIYRRFLAGLAP